MNARRTASVMRARNVGDNAWVPIARTPRARSAVTALATVAGIGAAGGLAALAGARVEAEAFILRRVTVPVLPAGAMPIRVLHLSDLHLSPRDHRRIAWTRGLAALEPDLVIDTGDNLGHLDGVPTVVQALEPLLELPGVFVFGSNDYYGPVPKNPLSYFGGPSKASGRPLLPTEELRRSLTGAGWLDLNNARGDLEIAGTSIRFTGLDDPHINLDRMPPPEPRPTSDRADGVVRLGVVHAPYRRALDTLVRAGSDLVLAGHTHGGQICLPFAGALVTNCDLPRRYAKGLHEWRVDAGQSSPLHVSAGLGTSPYARIRLFCRPEATLLTLTPH